MAAPYRSWLLIGRVTGQRDEVFQRILRIQMRRVPYGCVGEVRGGRLGQDRGGGEVQSGGRVGASGDTCRGRERQKGDRAALVASTHPAPPAPGHHCGDYGGRHSSPTRLGLPPVSPWGPNILGEVTRPLRNISPFLRCIPQHKRVYEALIKLLGILKQLAPKLHSYLHCAKLQEPGA